jgi:hypothetical protein
MPIPQNIPNQIESDLSDKKKSQITSLLYVLQIALEEMQSNVDTSYALHKIGKETELSKHIENTINNPLESLSSFAGDLNKKCLALVDSLLSKHFSKNKEILKLVYRTSEKNHLHYAIALLNDTIENRNKIFDILDTNPILDIKDQYPIYFQFTSEETINRILPVTPTMHKIEL